ncbi:MAG TPA: iron-sulfur cluster assembly protein [Thermoplasmata archaeon]|nr:iron-sulfur cluster assembly protein [Thermoplasmata archaeon]
MSDSAAATPPAPAPSGAPPVPKSFDAFGVGGAYAEREAKITENLKKIYDPEIPMNIVDLGLIYQLEWKQDDVTVRMTLTAPGCPVAGILAEEVKGAVERVGGVHSAIVDMVWDPPWSPERMSEFAKRQFGYL